jgi:hypothetical protein
MVALETMLKTKLTSGKLTCVGVYWTEHQANCLHIENANFEFYEKP